MKSIGLKLIIAVHVNIRSVKLFFYSVKVPMHTICRTGQLTYVGGYPNSQMLVGGGKKGRHVRFQHALYIVLA